MDVCRACLYKDIDMAPLNNHCINVYNLLTNLSVKLNDEFPQHFCESCMNAVSFFYDFRMKCVASEASLRAVKIENVCPENSVLLENKCDLRVLDCEFDNIKLELETFNSDMDDNDYANFDIKDENDVQPNETIILKENDMVELKLRLEKQSFTQRLRNKNSMCKTNRQITNDKKKMVKKRMKLAKLKEPKLKSSNPERKQPLFCGICNEAFIEKHSMGKHIESHRKDRKCEICSEIFPNWPELLSHRMSHLPKKQKMCHICPKRCATIIGMEYHYLKIHYDEKIYLGLQCKKCALYFETPKKLSRHEYSVHSTKLFICDYCSKRTNNKQKLATHIKSHSENKAYSCDLCGFSCRYKNGLKSHKIRKHSLLKVYCKKCKVPFHGEEALKNHKCNVPIRICPECGKQFSRGNSFTRHKTTHEDVGKYKCDRCPALYKSKTALIVHRDRHDGIRRQQCEYCPAKFYSLNVLIKHRRTHTGEKPFVCQICNRGFTGRHNLKVHMKVHGEMLIVKKNKDDKVVTNV